MFRRSFVKISLQLFVFLYMTYVRSYLEYCASILSRSFAKNIDVLKKVQKHATRIVMGALDTYLLKSLDLYTLFCQRQHDDLVEV